MAKKLDTMPAQARTGPKIRYPWTQWLDGSIWELTYGEDFDNPNLTSFAVIIRQMARRRGLTATVYRTGEKTLAVRATREPGP